MIKPMKYRKRVIDTCDSRHLTNKRYGVMNESIEFRTKYNRYDEKLENRTPKYAVAANSVAERDL